MDQVKPGDVLVADMTDPNWEPVMKRASAIVTNRGGRTCHAAIIARELGIPAIVGCGDATETLTEGEVVTVSCTEGTGHVYRGKLDFEVTTRDISAMPDVPVKVMMNVGNPELAFEFAQLPNAGVGLARVEFIINNVIGIHPKAILDVERLPASKRDEIKRRARGYASPKDSSSRSWSKACPPSPPPSGRTRSSSACPTSSPTSTASCSAASCTSRKKKTRCSASAAPRATSPSPSATASRWNAAP
jgi:phosphohistidine swiveling domain-containing protein